LPEGFEQIDSQRISYTIQPEQEHRMALLQMTPFAWRAKGDVQNKIQRSNGLEIEVDFILTLAVRK
ncbi:MAG: 23S rRNA (guanine(745)-N(1))-methyltransferase, partial [Methyloprofundus sp.]|nr:23S rRNA (guanine(745)-N(1))-methyltransferase [Methyloprofundus sp.]